MDFGLAALHFRGLLPARIVSNEWKSWQDNFRVGGQNGSNPILARSEQRREFTQ
jgi:hypothetical protein